MAKAQTLETLLQQELQDILDAENRLVKALPKMAKAATSPELQDAIREHLEVTKGQVDRLKQVFEQFGFPAKSKTCAGMKGLVEEGQETISEMGGSLLGDAAIIGGAQRVEHYEMAAYGTVRAIAEQLGNNEAADLLQQTLDEEKEADEKLNEIAMQIYEQIQSGSSEEEEGEAMGQASSRSKSRSSASRKPKTRTSSGS
jgi:ferritin-like metal-binding protein YciE